MSKSSKNGNNGKVIKMSDMERLELENFQLKIAAVQAAAQRQIAPLVAGQEALAVKVGERLGIDLKDFNVNLDNGVLTPRPQNQEATN